MTDDMRHLDREAERRCTHEAEWIGTSGGRHLNVQACWSCVLDVYFEHKKVSA